MTGGGNPALTIMPMPDWITDRLLYLEYLLWAGLGGGGAAIAAALSANHPLTRETWLAALGISLAMIFARSRQTPREEWDDARRAHELDRKRKLASLEAKQEDVAEAVKAVSATIEEVKRDDVKP